MRKVLSLTVAVLFAGALGACEQQPVSPDSSASTQEKPSDDAGPPAVNVTDGEVSLADVGEIAAEMRARRSGGGGPAAGPVARQELPLVVVDGGPLGGEQVGTVSVRRNPRNNTMSFTLRLNEILERQEGHAYTLWWGNPPLTQGGGWGGGGVVTDTDRPVVLSDNHCVWSLDTFWDGGFRPGKKPSCDLVDVEGTLVFALLIHDEWEPGDKMEMWDPDGDPNTADGDDGPIPGFPQCFSGANAEDECDSFKADGRTMIAAFGPLD